MLTWGDLSDNVLSVVSPLGGEVDACTICRGCVVGFEGHDLVVELVVLDMVGYDIILGMDCMSAYHATIDCHKKRVTISLSGGPVIVFSGSRHFVGVPMWGSEVVGLVSLASIREEHCVVANPGCVPVVDDFVVVFPDVLPDLPPW